MRTLGGAETRDELYYRAILPGLSMLSDHSAMREPDEPAFRRRLSDNEGMSKENHGDHRHADTGPRAPHESAVPYWKRAHKDWKFWVGAVCIAVAIVIYVLTLDLSSVPR